MQFLLGTRAQLEPVWKAFAIQPQAKALEHSAHTVLADARDSSGSASPSTT